MCALRTAADSTLLGRGLLDPAGARCLLLGLQVAIRNNQQGVFYFNDSIPLSALLREDGILQPSAFIPAWKSLPDANEAVQNLQVRIASPDAVSRALQAVNFALQVRTFSNCVVFFLREQAEPFERVCPRISFKTEYARTRWNVCHSDRY